MFRSIPLTSVAVVVVYSTVYLVMLKSSRPSVVVSVHNAMSVADMTRTIQEQRDKIEDLTANQRVVYQCPDEVSSIKYPKYASDDLTETLMETNDECGNTSITDAIVIVHTSANHFKHRERFRRTYSNYNTQPYVLKVVFLIGSVVDADLKIQLEMENREFGDTVVGDFLDTYQNLTLKAVMGFRWLTRTCSRVKLLIKMDDDVFFDVRKFFSSYWDAVPNSRRKRSIHCLVWNNALVGRTGKWKVERHLFANASYHFPYCAGFFAIVTPDLIPSMYERGKNINFFWIDDVFLYGMVPAEIKGVNFVQLKSGRGVTTSYKEYKQCRDNNAAKKCNLFAALTDSDKQFEQQYAAHFVREPTNKLTSVKKTQTFASNQSKPLFFDSMTETNSQKQLPESVLSNTTHTKFNNKAS